LSKPDYIIGIDLGTTNSALAFAPLSPDPETAVLDLRIPQLVRLGEVSDRGLLPSCLYIPGEHELPPDSCALPWPSASPLIVGEFARWQGAQVPGRLVASAKSWLCHSGVDRTADILPWGAPPDLQKLSPVQASSLILSHLAHAWNQAHPQTPIEAQEVVLTIPASFDEVARALTLEAARRSGLGQLTLVEEPQAAFHDFAHAHRRNLTEALAEARLALVVDVGGGTTDFSLIRVQVIQGNLELERIAVGEHLMLGGDNMDAALARLAEERLTQGTRKLTAAQWHQLIQATRTAKETLLASHDTDSFPITIASGGSRLLGSTLSTRLNRSDVLNILLDGFFPEVPYDAAPKSRSGARVALQELGLPYAQDPAITRHLAEFLARHRSAGNDALLQPTPARSAQPQSQPHPQSHSLPRPDVVLLNGGVFKAEDLTRRLLHVISAWWPNSPPIRVLDHSSLESAVARGAVAHGLARHGLARRIGGGAAHAFYVGLAGSKTDPTPKALCVIPRGHRENQVLDLTERSFTLTLGRPVQFPLYSTTSDRVDPPGAVVDLTDDLLPLPPSHSLLKGANLSAATIPVHLRALVTEVGTLELWCVSNLSEDQWRLEFDLRGVADRSTSTTVAESLPSGFEEARVSIERVFGSKPCSLPPREVKQLGRTLESSLGPKTSWSLSVLRELWSVLFSNANRRRRSADHERVFYQLLGYTLRPGFGYPLDDWRCEQSFRLFQEGVSFHSEQPNWNEFWVLWRRIAAGLSPTHQATLWAFLKPHLAKRILPIETKSSLKPKGIQPEGLDEMVRVAAALEDLPPQDKEELGGWIAQRLTQPAIARGPWAWALGRIGARWPLRASGHQVVRPDQAAEWLQLLLSPQILSIDGAPFAAVSLARLTGDRNRDLPEDLRLQTVSQLTGLKVPSRWCQLLTEVIQLDLAEESQSLGDTLPIGLRL